MSRENRFKILPGGFTLKNLIVVDISDVNILLCRVFEALMHTLLNEIDRRVATTKIVAIRTL